MMKFIEGKKLKLLGVSLLVFLRSWCAVHGAPLCLLGDFDSQVQTLLSHVMLTPQEINNITMTFDDLQDTLRIRWEGAELFVYGSLPSGLAAKASDVDFYLRIPKYNDTADAYIVTETAKLLAEYPDKYGDVQQKLHQIVPMMTYYDISLQRYIDLSFRGAEGIYNTKFVAYSLNLDDRHRTLAAIIKFWLKVHHITGKKSMPSYVGYLLVIFYLQQKKMVPSGNATQANLPALIINKWNTNFKEIPFSIDNNETLYELLGGFFKYYSEFNFKDYCVSPFVGRPIARRDFEDVDTVPEELSFYKVNVKIGDYDPLPLEADMCVQDIYEHNSNDAKRVNRASFLNFVNNVRYAAAMYNILRRDRFLRSILVQDNRSEMKLDLPLRHEDTILKFKECVNIMHIED